MSHSLIYKLILTIIYNKNPTQKITTFEIENPRKKTLTVSDEVDPEELDGDESLGEAEGSGQEDGDDLTNVGGDQVSDELLHVVVDGTALLNGG